MGIFRAVDSPVEILVNFWGFRCLGFDSESMGNRIAVNTNTKHININTTNVESTISEFLPATHFFCLVLLKHSGDLWVNYPLIPGKNIRYNYLIIGWWSARVIVANVDKQSSNAIAEDIIIAVLLLPSLNAQTSPMIFLM